MADISNQASRAQLSLSGNSVEALYCLQDWGSNDQVLIDASKYANQIYEKPGIDLSEYISGFASFEDIKNFSATVRNNALEEQTEQAN